MKISLDLTKSVEQNASVYFEKAKKAKKKIQGARKAMEESYKKLAQIDKKIQKQKSEEHENKEEKRKLEWYEKFRWFFSSKGFFIIAGRDATTNEIIIKKHTDKNDLVFHTNIAGSPFAVIKSDNKKIDEDTIKEAAQFVACYSRAWKLGMSSLEVFYVKPEQVTKEAPSGEYIQKGSFMIYGKKNTLNPLVKIFLGVMKDGKIMAGPEEAVKKHCEKYIEIFQGSEKASSVAKKIKAKIGGDLDDIIRVLPPGGCKTR
ncbi:DUF814 domain-containing protein [Candidatus Woesearchaeota archaeon]|nr:DUF814 domain-containing protein [Candidatus Woesearchaeota archaeon]